jgi:hypothetical protein
VWEKGEGTVEDGEKEVKVRVGNGEVKWGKRKGGREGLRKGKWLRDGRIEDGKREGTVEDGQRERLRVEDGEKERLG